MLSALLIIISLLQTNTNDRELYLAVYTSQSCPPCNKFKNDFNTDQDKLKSGFKHVYKVDIDNVPESYKKMYNYSKITIVPTFVIYEVKNGVLSEVSRKVGYNSKDDFLFFLNKVKNEKSKLGFVDEK